MIIVAGEIHMQPGTREQFFDAVAPLVAASRAEPGCRHYVFTPDLDDHDLIRLYELWEDEQAMRAHFESEHMDAWQDVRRTLPIASSNLLKFTVTDVVELH